MNMTDDQERSWPERVNICDTLGNGVFRQVDDPEKWRTKYGREVRDYIPAHPADRFADLKEGWDSYGAKQITPEAIKAAKAVWFVPLPNGGIQVEARLAGGEIEFEINPDGSLGVCLYEPAEVVPTDSLKPIIEQLREICRLRNESGHLEFPEFTTAVMRAADSLEALTQTGESDAT